MFFPIILSLTKFILIFAHLYCDKESTRVEIKGKQFQNIYQVIILGAVVLHISLLQDAREDFSKRSLWFQMQHLLLCNFRFKYFHCTGFPNGREFYHPCFTRRKMGTGDANVCILRFCSRRRAVEIDIQARKTLLQCNQERSY